ncbi:MerR family transcriptional regulator [Acidithiobacillus caldus]
MTEEKPLTLADAARMFGVSRSTVKRWNRQGLLQESGRTTQGWRYFLFTDIEELLRDLCHKKNDQL